MSPACQASVLSASGDHLRAAVMKGMGGGGEEMMGWMVECCWDDGRMG